MSEQSIYAVGGTVQASGGIYISRDADEELLRLCRAGEFCYVLTAHQTGKSSLMVATMERLAAEGIRSVEIDLTQIGTESLGLTAEQWYLGLIDLVVGQLDLDVDYMAWWDERARLGPTQRLSQFLRQVVLEQASEPVVIFVDEIDSTLNLDFTDDFFAAIRACYNARARDPAFKRLSFVLLGVATPSDLISDPQHTPFNMGRRVDLADFTNQQAVPLADGLGLPPVEAGQILTWILDWTGGHPYLTQRLCAAAAASPTKTRDAAAVDSLVEKTFLSEQRAQDSNLRFVRDMLTQRAPDKAAVLKTYRHIHAGQTVSDERSPVKAHLKLSGVVKPKGDHLVVRNRIYQQVFNQDWISQNMPRNWARWIAVVSIILVLLLGGILGYYIYREGQQTTEAQAQAFIDHFWGTTDADERITSLAGLFELAGYEDRARKLFYEELTAEERQVLFAWVDPQVVGAQLAVVVKGLYTKLENNDQDNQLLEAMAQLLRALDDPRAVSLTTEVEKWIQGREAYAGGNYEQAVIAYSVAISLNDANPAAHFDRAVAYASLGRYEEALADFERALQLDEEWESVIDEEIRSRGALHSALTDHRTRYLKLAAVVPTLAPTSTFTSTPTPTFTSTPAPTLIPTRTPTGTPTPTPTPTDTPAAMVIPKLAKTATPTPTLVVAGKIAFSVFDPIRGTYDLFVANADGTGRQKIKEEASQPCFGPDESEITYRSWRCDKRGLIVSHTFGDDIWTIVILYEASRPSVSKAGTLYHFRQEVHRPGYIHLINDNSGEPKVITWGDQRQPIYGESPAWVSGERLVYKGYLGATSGLYLTDSLYEKTGITQLTDEPTDKNPEPSPDGKKIAFMSRRDGNWEIYVMDLDTRTVKRLTHNGANDGLPIWSPDGQTIAFASDRSGEWAIWAMNPDGSNQQMLFPLGGSLHGYVRDVPLHERGGWEEERLSWSP